MSINVDLASFTHASLSWQQAVPYDVLVLSSFANLTNVQCKKLWLTPSCAADRVDLVSKQVAESLGGKGGGRSGRYQGKAAKITQAQVQQAMQTMTAQ